MAGRIAASLELTKEQRQELNTLDRAHSTPQKLAERARIILLAADGVSVSETARRLGIWRKTASTVRSSSVVPSTSHGSVGGLFKGICCGWRAKQSSQKWPSWFCERTLRKRKNLSGHSLGNQRKSA